MGLAWTQNVPPKVGTPGVAQDSASPANPPSPVGGFMPVVILLVAVAAVVTVLRARRRMQPAAFTAQGRTTSVADEPDRSASTRDEALERHLEELQGRLVRNEIAEATYGELRETLLRRHEQGLDLVPPKAAESPRPERHVVERHVEKVVERQVLVMRCRYCHKLTPADLSVCENCGAAI